MIKLRLANDRGHANHGWLDTHHTFSFADYYDPDWVHFRTLRVMNEDHIAGGSGFGMHPHRDMEIVTVVLNGALKHKDSMGNTGVIQAGDVQRMSAGTGVFHSEFNPLSEESTHLYQIWILPEKHSTEPSYEQKNFALSEIENKLMLVASPTGENGSVTIGQDVKLYRSKLDAGKTLEQPITTGRSAWLQIISGEAVVNGHAVRSGDGVGFTDEKAAVIKAEKPTEFLLFDLN